jgi:hypothetical protein
MRDLEKLGRDKNSEKKTTLEEDLSWWSVMNLWSFFCKNVDEFDDEVSNYVDIKFTLRLSDWERGSYAGSVTMPMLRTNTGKIVEDLAVQFVGKK